MSTFPSGSSTNYGPQIKGYRIRQQIRNEQDQKPIEQTLLKIVVKNESNGIPKIRNDVICNGKHYPFIPLFSFTSEEDLSILEQISTIVLRDQNDILCEILSGKVKEVKASQFKELKHRFKAIFSLQLKVDPQELFLLLISDEITKENQFNEVFDSISETDFVNVLKKIYENCPNRIVPKILRKIAKYFNSTKGRQANSIERLKRLLKIIKAADQGNDIIEKQEAQQQNRIPSKKQLAEEEQDWVVVPAKKKSPSKKQSVIEQPQQLQKTVKIEQNQAKKSQQPAVVPVKQSKEIVNPTVELQKVTKKVTQTQKVKKTQKVTKKQKIIKAQKAPLAKKQEQKPASENEQDWHDVDEHNEDSSEEEDDITDSIGKMAFHPDESDEDLKYLGPKKKGNKKAKNNITMPLDPEFDRGTSKKQAHPKKQKKNYSNNNTVPGVNTSNNYNKQPKVEAQDSTYDRRNNNNNNAKPYRNNNNNNRGRDYSNNEQSLQKGRRQYSKEKKIDARIFLGLNGASDSAWRERMRPPRYPNRNEHDSYDRNRGQSIKENRDYRDNRRTRDNNRTTPQKDTQPSAIKGITKQNEQSAQQSKNLTLSKVFSIPEDLKDGKQFTFQKRNYNLFINKLFWVNISDGQVTIQKDGKGYIRKCPIEIIDNGKGIMAEGITINTDGISNLEDGGTAFGDPVFEEFTPNGQWFHITSLDVFAYV